MRSGNYTITKAFPPELYVKPYQLHKCTFGRDGEMTSGKLLGSYVTADEAKLNVEIPA